MNVDGKCNDVVQDEEDEEEDIEENKEIGGEELESLKQNSEEYQFGLKAFEKSFLGTTEKTDEVASAIDGSSFVMFSKSEIIQKKNEKKQIFDIDDKNIDAYWCIWSWRL